MAHSSDSYSTRFAETLGSLYKSAQALTEVETQSRLEITRTASETREARNARDAAVAALHSAQLETQASKASLTQAEMTIEHQNETITQLRREMNQWRDQSRNWQEHFLRVEQERCALSTRIDELVAERLNHVRIPPTSYASNPPYSETTSSISTSSKRASSPSSTQPPAYKATAPLLDTPISAPRPTRPAAKQIAATTASKNRRGSADTSSSTSKPPQKAPRGQKGAAEKQPIMQVEPRQTLIRRVHAVIHVKAEEDETDGEFEAAEAVAFRNQRARAQRIVSDGEGGISDDDAEDDDELTMGAEDNHNEVYGTQRVLPSSKESYGSAVSPPPQKSKKRKLAASANLDKPVTKRKL